MSYDDNFESDSTIWGTDRNLVSKMVYIARYGDELDLPAGAVESLLFGDDEADITHQTDAGELGQLHMEIDRIINGADDTVTTIDLFRELEGVTVTDEGNGVYTVTGASTSVEITDVDERLSGPEIARVLNN